MRQGLTEHNPVLGTEPPAAETEGSRVLTPEELAIVWRACGEAGEFGTIVRLLMLTGQRREEVAGLEWAELDLDRALWVIPSARTKNKLEHEVPLPRQAVALLPEKREGRAHLFGRGKKGGFSGFSRSKARLVESIAKRRAREVGHDPAKVDLEKWKLPAWTLHDCRRTAGTCMHEIGVEPHIVEAILNHVSGHKGGVAGTYNKARYREPKKVALQRWADWLEATVEGRTPASNVVALAR
jgi:integrase